MGGPLAGRPAQCRWEQGFMERCVAGQNVAQHVGAWTSRRPTLGTLQNRPPQGRRENAAALCNTCSQSLALPWEECSPREVTLGPRVGRRGAGSQGTDCQAP